MATGESLRLHRETIELIEEWLPNLSSGDVDWDKASHPTEDYNCMGMAVGFKRWWSPPDAPGVVRNPRDYWPPFITGDKVTIEAFIEAAETAGYRCCDGLEWEEGFDKIVLFHKDGDFTHAAALIVEGRWMSKFGDLSDFDHTLNALADSAYGNGCQYMKRPRQSVA